MDTNEASLNTTEQNDAKVPVSNPKPKRNVPDKIKEALMLPTCMNLNPRSVYNKSMELVTFIKEEQVHCVFISESWERPEFDLSKLLDIEDFTVISNPHQRQGQGGRPALIINTKYYNVRNLTNSLISIPWGCEATWALMSPKKVQKSSKIQNIAVCSLYSKPNSRNKTKLLDHISFAYNVISAKYQNGLHFIIAGDTNDLKLDSILLLNPRMKQVVKGATRMDPPRMLDPILTTLGPFYQSPQILPPLDSDPDKDGRPSDHWIPLMRPINVIDNTCTRTYTEITVRPIHRSGMALLRNWFQNQDWAENLQLESVDMKADLLMSQILGAVDNYLPSKVIRVASDDEPWFTQHQKKLDRRRRREYNKNRRSKKYKFLNSLFLEKVAMAKKNTKEP